MTTALQRTSLGELGYSPLTTTSLGELAIATVIKILNPSGGGDDASDTGVLEREDMAMIAIIKEFMSRI